MPKLEWQTSEMLRELRGEEYLIDVGRFAGKDIITSEQFTPAAVARVMEIARMLEEMPFRERRELLAGFGAAIIFYEASSRTYGSFVRAAQKMGMDLVPMQGMNYSSVSKGENLSDTVRTFQTQAEVIILRHPDDDAALVAAKAARVPIINAGSGKFEHPTQSLLDFYTILREVDPKKRLADLHVTFIGDLANGRTVHSLAKLLTRMGMGSGHGHFTFVSPEVTRLPENLKNWLIDQGVNVHETESLEEVAGQADVLYMTRVQAERFSAEDRPALEVALQGSKITGETLKLLQPRAVIMHPFPRVDEIAPEVDADPRAAYFRQMDNGVPVRMALLALVLGAVR